jgi:hypothetical protein
MAQYGVGDIVQEIITNNLDLRIPPNYRIIKANPAKNVYLLRYETNAGGQQWAGGGQYKQCSREELDTFFQKISSTRGA